MGWNNKSFIWPMLYSCTDYDICKKHQRKLQKSKQYKKKKSKKKEKL